MVEEDNLIDEFVEMEQKYIDAPDIFIYTGGYWIIAATLGPLVENLDVPIGATHPNIYTILSSKPAGRRSTLMRHCLEIQKKAWIIFFNRYPRTLIDNPAEIVKKKYFKEFSIPGIVDNINASVEENIFRDYNLFNTEFGAFVSKSSNIGYLNSCLGFLSELYYGEPHVEHFSMKSKNQSNFTERSMPENIYFNLFGGTQKFGRYFGEAHITQGFLRRCLLVPAKKEDFTRDINYIDHNRSNSKEDYNAFAEKIANRMLDMCDKTYTIIDNKTENYVNKLDNKIKKLTLENEDKDYFSSQGEILYKLTTLNGIANINNPVITDEISNTKHLSITFDACKHTIATLFKETMKRSEEVIEEILLPKEKEKIDSFSRRKDNYVKKLERSNNWTTNITKLMGTTLDKARPIVETLLREERFFGIQVTPNEKHYRRFVGYTTDIEIVIEKRKEYEAKGWEVIDLS